MPAAREILDRTATSWLEDPESDVVHCEWLEGRLAVRVRQQVREATTVWWEVGERTVRAEAYVIPAPSTSSLEPYRLCLVRNHDALRVWFALDADGAVVIRAREPVERVDRMLLDQVLGEIYSLVELTFRPLVRAAFPREKSG